MALGKIAQETLDAGKPLSAAAAPGTAEKPKWQAWGAFYSAHSPVQYAEMVTRWGGERQLWEAYAASQMERDEAAYFEGPRMFSAARAFANVVIPMLHAMEERLRLLEELFGAATEPVQDTKTP